MKREELYHSFLDNMHSGFALFEIAVSGEKNDFVFIDANKKFYEYFELNEGDILLRRLSEMRNKFFPNLEPFLQRINQIGVPAVYEASCGTTERIFELNAYPFDNSFIALQVHNVTKRKSLEKAYIESEENYRALADKTPISIISFDDKGIISFVNEYFLSSFCYGEFPKEHFIGQRFSDLKMCPKQHCAEIEKVLSNKFVELNDIEIESGEKGRLNYCNIRGVPLVRNNVLRGGIIIVEDINHRKRIEKELAQKNIEQELLLDNVDFMIWFMKSSKNIGLANYAFSDFFGVDKNFPDSKQLSDFLPNHEADELSESFHKVWKSKYPQYFDKFIFNKFGNKRLLKIKVTPKLNSNLEVEYLVCSANDITEQRRNEEEMKNLIVALKLSNKLTDERSGEIMELNRQLASSETKLKESLAAKDKFFSIIAHDLISPFQGFMSLTKYLSDHIDELDEPDVKDLASALNKSAVNLHKLLENLLNWSRVQRGSIHYHPEFIDIKQAVDLNVSLATPTAASKKISLTSLISETVVVYSDLNILNTIIRNLVSNAIKFTNYGGNIELKISQIDNDFIELSVKDDGVGIDQTTLDKIFQFDKYSSTLGTANETGTGLGLVLCKEFAVINKGSIRIESKLGTGATFFLSIPLREQL